MNNGNEMDELDKNLSDNFWRKTFEEAAETPPPRVWLAIEHQLNKSDGAKILPLWGMGLVSSRPVVWGSSLAAAVTLLLVGWWVINSESGGQHRDRMSQTAQISRILPVHIAPATSLANDLVNKRAKTITLAHAKVLKLEHPFDGSTDQLSPAQLIYQTAKKSIHGDKPTAIQRIITSASTAFRSTTPIEFMASVNQMSIGTYAADSRTTAGDKLSNSTALVAFTELVGKPIRLRKTGAIQRIVWVRPAEVAMIPEGRKSTHKTHEMWATASVMPNSFNPTVAVQSVQPAITALTKSISPNQPSVTSRANFSMAYQVGAGVQLTKHWSVESGIGYLSGHSIVEAPEHQALASGQLDILANHTTGSNNLYVDALQNRVQNNTQASYNSLAANTIQVNSAYDTKNIQTISNAYQYVQVPVQVGYQLRPRKRLSIAILGGLLTNVFVRNTVGNALVITNKEGIYRPVSLAATMSARLRYRSSRRWSASLAGIYQPSLELGTNADSQVQSRPTATGMSFGVDYHF